MKSEFLDSAFSTSNIKSDSDEEKNKSSQYSSNTTTTNSGSKASEKKGLKLKKKVEKNETTDLQPKSNYFNLIIFNRN